MNVSEFISELAFRHPKMGCGKSNAHFSSLGDESQVKSDTVLHYPCVLMNQEPESITLDPANPVRQYEISLLFLDHVVDTGNWSKIEDTYALMDEIACQFFRAIWANQYSLQIYLPETIQVERIENMDACLFGKMVTFTASMPFCLNDKSNI